MAGRDRARDAGPRRRAAGETYSGTDLVRPRRDDDAAGLRLPDGHVEGQHAAVGRQEEFYQARKKLGDEARNLPPGVLGPFVNDEYSDVSFGLYALKAKGMPMRELARQAEVIRQDLLHVPGVKKINILGERPEQIFVEFSYAKLATLGVSAQDIVSALQRQNTVTPAGSIDTRVRRSSSGSTAPMTASRRSPIRRSSPADAR
jgi:multidrug efflux pump subunit AcrB